MNSLIVRKYGGSSLATPEKIQAVARNLAQLRSEGHQVIAVVSAMGKSTDELIRLAHSLTRKPPPRELDMLISTGERISMSLLAMSLYELGCPAISFTGSQAGIMTSTSHTNAKIINLKPIRVDEELRAGKIIVIAGFQGVCPQTKEVTTLGRGGSDTSAVALAAHFKASKCEVLKDVAGVFSMDPKWGQKSRHLPALSYDHLYHMTYWGAKILHHRSVALAQKLGVPLTVGLAHGQGTSTTINAESVMYESMEVLATSHKENLLCAEWTSPHLHEGLAHLERVIETNHLPNPEKIHSERSTGGWCFHLYVPYEHLPHLRDGLMGAGFKVDPDLRAALTLTGYELASSSLLPKLTALLSEKNIRIHSLLTTPQGVSFIMPQTQLLEATQIVAATTS